MDFNFTERQKQLHSELVKSASAISDEIVEAGDGSMITSDTWKVYARTGIHSLPLQSEYGGKELKAVDIAVALVAFGQGCSEISLALAAAQHLISCIVPIWKFGSEQQKKTFLPSLTDGNRIAMLVAPRHDGPLTKDRLTFLKTQSGFQLSGKFGCAACTTQPDVLIVIVQDESESGVDGETTACLLQSDAAGVSRDFESGLLTFNNVALLESDVLGSRGQGCKILKTIDQWQQTYGNALRIGVMQRLLDQVLASAGRYSCSSKLTGISATRFQSAAHRLAEFNVAVEVARLLLFRAAWQFGISGEESADAAITGIFVDDTLRKCVAEALHVQQEYGLPNDQSATRSILTVLNDCGTPGELMRARAAIARQINLAALT